MLAGIELTKGKGAVFRVLMFGFVDREKQKRSWNRLFISNGPECQLPTKAEIGSTSSKTKGKTLM